VSAISEDICGLARGKTDLIVGSFFDGRADPADCASAAKLSLAPSCGTQIWKTPGSRVTACARRSMRLEIVSVSRL
jgi:hypothetical protein